MTTNPNIPAETIGRKPGLRRRDHNDMIPIGLIRAMFALAGASLLLVTLAVWTDRPLVAVPPPAPVLSEHRIILVGGGAQAVTVLNTERRIVADMAHGGFVTVIQNGLQRERFMHGLSPELPIRIVAYANGRLTAHDDHTGWSVELGNFGADNKAAFERLIAQLD
jgi:putative photosynthetic complex assembly protein